MHTDIFKSSINNVILQVGVSLLNIHVLFYLTILVCNDDILYIIYYNYILYCYVA